METVLRNCTAMTYRQLIESQLARVNSVRPEVSKRWTLPILAACLALSYISFPNIGLFRGLKEEASVHPLIAGCIVIGALVVLPILSFTKHHRAIDVVCPRCNSSILLSCIQRNGQLYLPLDVPACMRCGVSLNDETQA